MSTTDNGWTAAGKTRRARPPRPWQRWRRRHRQALAHAGRRLRERPGAHVFALALLTVAVLAVFLLWLGLHQFQHLGRPLDQARTLSLFLDPQLDEAAAAVLADELAADPRVAVVEAISPEQGLAELSLIRADQGVFEALPDNPLPWVLAVDPVDRGAATDLAEAWRQRPQVEYLADEGEWHDRAAAVLAIARAVALLIAGLVGLASLLLVATAVRTIRVEGREERALQRVFGATEADLRRPYLYLGLLYGLLAGLLAMLLAGALLLALQPALAGLAAAFDLSLSRHDLPWMMLPAMPLLAGLAAVAGAWLGCRFEPDLEAAQ
ncbi:MAG: permease-like cell division protein FtsX [Xanthomonadales bacterium]|nr:permease-like cell division protein FtsX [Xanthomonadales bacterium]